MARKTIVALFLVGVLAAQAVLADPTVIAPSTRVVVLHKAGIGFAEILLAPGIGLVYDYKLFSVVDATANTKDWLNLNKFHWWDLDQKLSHGNYTWDPVTDPNPIPSSLRSSTTNLRLVQFVGPMPSEWVTDVRNRGTVFGVSSNQTIVANLSDAAVTQLRGLSYVRQIERFHPGLKLPPGYQAVTGTANYTLTFDPLINIEGLIRQVQHYSGVAVHCVNRLPGMGYMLINATRSSLESIVGLDGIIGAERTSRVEQHDYETVWLTQSNSSSDPRRLSGYGLTGAGETITFTDHSLDLNLSLRPRHERMEDNTTVGLVNHYRPVNERVVTSLPGGTCTVYSLANADHLMQVTGMAVGNIYPFEDPNDNSANSRSDGPAYRARPHWQAYGTNTTDLFPTLDVARYLRDSHENFSSEVQSISWGFEVEPAVPAYGYASMNIDTYLWNHKNHSLFVSAGNAGIRGIGTVAGAKNAITIGASNESGPWGAEENAYVRRCATNAYPCGSLIWTHFASQGNNVERRKPLLVAPSSKVSSLMPGEAGYMDQFPSTRNLTGTSYSTPAVAAEAVLMKEYFRNGYYPDGVRGGTGQTISAALVRALMVSGAHPIRAGIGDTIDGSPHLHLKVDNYPNQVIGWGRLVSDDVLFFSAESNYPGASAQRKLVVFDRQVINMSNLAAGNRTFRFEVMNSNVPLNIVTTWTDCPAVPGALRARCGDLLVTARSPSGKLYFGNVMVPLPSTGQNREFAPTDTLGTLELVPDLVNLEQVIRRRSPEVGTWEVVVTSVQIPERGLDFSVAVTGAVA